ncbi:hypothetical protein J8J14_20185 [Roseomonas sp. SSH11]|uniref:Uncharacterized protein n=1 Tax=Pararoseomonas baculiformis TaxID=2820812 RepID=A0ABS4ALL1_9PROT|nr:hypothetical protein [Pararoseomonas baculiformis]MBP0447099.1 hypothetical protein [Pararoseomonas baculiformis]
MADPKVQQQPEVKELRETGGWEPGVQPGIGRGAELDEALEKDPTHADPALKSPLPGFVDHPDPVESRIEGEGVATARNAIEDLPRQG